VDQPDWHPFFLDLLERQFPIESINKPLSLKTPSDFAAHLFVHVNHLNRVMKEVTGKSTSFHISERVYNESKKLLYNTDWTINEIAASLGFEYQNHFNVFFKKVAGKTPSEVRGKAI
jgi:AraC-like DNA-binding protein